MAKKPSQILKSVRQRNYLAKDFDSLKSVILNYAQTYYPDRMTDFSENSLGGLFLDMAAYVGDNMSFYLDHQFNELDPDTVVELTNLQKLIKSAGIKATGASPAYVTCTFLIEVSAVKQQDSNGNTNYIPKEDCLPVVKAGSIFSTPNGINFRLLKDINFSQRKSDGSYFATIKIGKTFNQEVSTLYVTMEGDCVSGFQKEKIFSIGTFKSFRKITLPDTDVHEIVRVTDSNGNIYYEVSDLSEDVVYTNIAGNSQLEEDKLQLIPAPYRFTKDFDLTSKLTSLTFGGGNADSLEDDVIPDPSEFAIPLPGTSTFSRTAINPRKLLTTRTLGVAAENVSLSIVYRYGGGLFHNVNANSITIVQNLDIVFPLTPTPSLGQSVTNSLEVTNVLPANGGENAPTANELKELINASKTSQERIVTKEDLLARVYTLPSNFGRVFRASVRANTDNPLATKLFVVSRDLDGNLTTSSDVLKENLARYLNSYRLISDAIDILDSPIINVGLKFNVVIDPKFNPSLVIQSIILQLKNYFDIRNSQIDKPINLSDISNIIYTIDGVTSIPINGITVSSITGVKGVREYSNFNYDIKSATLVQRNLIVPPEGGIFEMKYPDLDIEGQSV